jgi:hypothetical protein
MAIVESREATTVSGEAPCVRTRIRDLKIVGLKVTIHERGDTYVSRDGRGGNGRSP